MHTIDPYAVSGKRVSLSECPACGSHELGASSRIKDYEYDVPYEATYVACGSCGTLFQTPMPGADILSSFYPDHYHSLNNEGLLNRIRNRIRVRRLRKFLRKGDVVLDYGCGNGSFIEFAAKAIPDCSFIGYEIASQSHKLNLSERVVLIRGTLADLLKEIATCNLITMNHVIEHLPNPFLTITALYAKLASGGVLEGQTPASGSAEHKVFGKFWSGYHAPRHTVIFSREGLTRFLKRSGFERVKNEGALNPAALAVSLASCFRRTARGKIRRDGGAWLFWVCCATLLVPLDLLSGSPGIINFVAQKGSRS